MRLGQESAIPKDCRNWTSLSQIDPPVLDIGRRSLELSRIGVPLSLEFGTLSRSSSGILLLRIDSSDATRHLPKVQVMSGSLTLIPTSSCRRLWRFTCMAGISPTEQLRLHLLVPRSTHLKGHPGRRQGRWWSGGGKGGAGNAVFMRLVEIGANRQSCDASMNLLLKLVLEVMLGLRKAAGCR